MVHYGYAHRDLKAENILIHPNSLFVKIVDFGLAAIATPSSESTHHTGTPIYMSPQVLMAAFRPTVYNIMASEVWSVGTLLFEMLMGAHPFKSSPDIPNLIERLRSVESEIFAAPLTTASKSLLSKFLRYEEAERIEFSAAVNLLRSLAPSRNPRHEANLSTKSLSSPSSTPATPLAKSKKNRSAYIFFASHGTNRKPDGTTPKSHSGMTSEVASVSFRTILSKSTSARIERTSQGVPDF